MFFRILLLVLLFFFDGAGVRADVPLWTGALRQVCVVLMLWLGVPLLLVVKLLLFRHFPVLQLHLEKNFLTSLQGNFWVNHWKQKTSRG